MSFHKPYSKIWSYQF